MVLHSEGKKKKGKQMRVPQVEPKDNIEGLSSFLDDIVSPLEKKEDPPPPPDKARTIATDDGEIEKAGTAFLDQIGKSMGFGQG